MRKTVRQTDVYLSRVLVNVDVDNSSMLVTLLDDVVQDVLLPARGRLAENTVTVLSHDLTHS